MRPSRPTITIASGAASSRPRNFVSALFRAVMSRMALETNTPSSVSSRLKQIPELHLGPFSLGDFPIDLENPGRGTLRIPLQSPPAGHDNARAVALAMDQFALPAPVPQ